MSASILYSIKSLYSFQSSPITIIPLQSSRNHHCTINTMQKHTVNIAAGRHISKRLLAVATSVDSWLGTHHISNKLGNPLCYYEQISQPIPVNYNCNFFMVVVTPKCLKVES